jgi:hypothetical protein
MMGVKAPETCWATHKRQVINLWNCCIQLVNVFELYDDARTCRQQRHLSEDKQHSRQTLMPPAGFKPAIPASQWPQIHTLDRAANKTGSLADRNQFLIKSCCLLLQGKELAPNSWLHGVISQKSVHLISTSLINSNPIIWRQTLYNICVASLGDNIKVDLRKHLGFDCVSHIPMIQGSLQSRNFLKR